ncbi:WD repeat-containing protein 43 [Toxocara canis]|uniref:WD repeat-containing protein 43 n=1 Tax=Toxocara canis TaxID=6265 RepID=A0A0B2VL06_TOXCA|nr:WD repeat-containing protein 43 [Toxocara canis]
MVLGSEYFSAKTISDLLDDPCAPHSIYAFASLRMRRRSAKQNGGVASGLHNGPMCDGDLNGALESDEKTETSNKAKGPSHSAKKQKNDVKDLALKDRLKAFNESRHNAEEATKKDTAQYEREATMQLVDNASTSKGDRDQETKNEEVTRGESLAVLLSQGLTSGDAEKIDAVLTKTDPQTITATLSELPITQILPLLKQIEFRFRNRKALDVRCWARWVQYTISMHAAYLSTIGSLENELGTLYSWMRSRSDHIGALYNLHGKLMLLVEQIERRANPKFFIFQQPTVLFNDDAETASERSESSDEIEENESVPSDDDWWEDEDIASDGSELSNSGGKRTASDEESSEDEEDEEGSEQDEDEEEGESVRGKKGSNDEMDVD